jgi:hypothetical protein
MADTVVSDLVLFKLRRAPEGLKVTVETSPAFEASLKARARGEVYDRSAGGDYVSTHYVRENPTSDAEVGHMLFAVGSSKPGGTTINMPLVRTRDQLVKVAEEVSAWVERHMAAYMRAIEVTATVKARSFLGLPPESDVSASAQNPA